MDFVSFLVVTAILFIRPGDFVPGLEKANPYLFAIVPCMLLSWHKLLPELSLASVRKLPVLAFGIGILLLTVGSSLLRGEYKVALDFGLEFPKILLFYLLMQVHVDSVRRIKLFGASLVGMILVQVVLAVLHYHGIIHIDAFSPKEDLLVAKYGSEVGIRRLNGTGNFNDPNDICEIINCALFFSIYGLLDGATGALRALWLVPMALLGHGLALTHSRGGFLAFMVGLMLLFQSRFRAKKGLVLAGVVLPLMFVLFGGRQTEFDTKDGTSQSRIQYWDGALLLFRQAPVMGIGINEFGKNNDGHACHNAFLQTYAELGFIGGTLLFGQYYYCVLNLARLRSKQITVSDPEMRRLQPFLLAAVASFATSEMSLTNPLSLITYVMLGLGTVFVRLANPSPPLPEQYVSWRLVRRIITFSAVFVLAFYVFVRLTVRH